MNASPRRRFFRRALYGGLAAALFLVFLGFYRPFFSPAAAFGLAALFSLVVWAMFAAGDRLFRPGRPFPAIAFTALVIAFSGLRWFYVGMILRHYLPDTTVFFYPRRAIWFIVPTTAALLFVGYGRAQYRYFRRRELGADVSDPAPTRSAVSDPAPTRSAVSDPAPTRSAGAPSPSPAPAYAPARRPLALAPEAIGFRSGGQDVLLPLGELLHVRARGEYLIYRCADRQYPRFQRMKEAAVELGAYGFIRTHRSHLVAPWAVRALSAKELVLTDGSRVPVSRTYRARVRAGFSALE